MMMPGQPEQTVQPPVFISYSRANRQFAEQLRQEVMAIGFNVWRDLHGIPAGARDWWESIREAIRECDTMVVCMSMEALRSPIVSEEWNYARQLGKRVIPVIADEVFKHPDVVSRKFILPGWMTRANWMDLRDTAPERESVWQNFVSTLRTLYTPYQVKITIEAQKLPHNFVMRSAEFEPMIAAMVNENRDAVAITAALRGAGGYGKTTLARALCRDMRISGAFDDGIFWVTLGERLLEKSGDALENDLVARLLDLVEQMTGKRPGTATLEAAQQALAEAVRDKYLLLVVDDVWHTSHLAPFLVKDKHNATLITTRFEDVLPGRDDMLRFPVDAMQKKDSLELLTSEMAAAGVTISELNGAQPALEKLAFERLKGWALLLSMVNGVLVGYIRDYQKTLPEALEIVNVLLDETGLTAFDPDNPVERVHAAGATIEAGLSRMKNESDRMRFVRLCIFQDDVSVPLETVAALWGMKQSILAMTLCEKLAKASLLSDYDGRQLRLHDVTRAYIRKKYEQNLIEWNQQFLDSCQITEWYMLSPEESYLWHWLSYHLAEAERLPELYHLLRDFRYLQAKLNAAGATSLLADYAFSGQDETLSLLESAVRLSLPALEIDKHQLAGQLAGRLNLYRSLPEIAAFVNDIDYPPDTLRALPSSRNMTHLQAGEALLHTLRGHSGGVVGAVVLSGGRLLSWSEDSTLRLWDNAGSPVAELRGHQRAVTGAVVLSDGRILSWSEDNMLRLWNNAGSPLVVLQGHTAGVVGAQGLSDGRLLSWSNDSTLRLWDNAGHPLMVLRGHSERVSGALELSDERLVSWSNDSTLRLWDNAGHPLMVLRGHTGRMAGALELSDGRLLSWSGGVGSSGSTLRLWENSGVLLADLKGHTGSVAGALELSDSRLLSWSAGPGVSDHTLRLWDKAGQSLAVLKGHTDRLAGALELSDGRLLSWSWDKTLQLWDKAGQSLAVLKGHTDRLAGALELSDGRLLSWCAAGSSETALRLWVNPDNPPAVLQGHTGTVTGVLELFDGRLLSWSQDGTLRLWDTANVSSGVSHEHPGSITGLRSLPGGRSLSLSEDGTLRIWDSSANRVTVRGGLKNKVAGVLPVADDRLLSWSGDKTLRLWDSAGSPLVVLKGHADRVTGAIEPSDGRLLSWSWDKTLHMWDSAGHPLAVLKGHADRVTGAIELSDGRLLSWSWDKALRLWQGDGNPLHVIREDTGRTAGVLELSDGRLVSWSESAGSSGSTIRLRDSTGTPLNELTGHTGRVVGALQLHSKHLLAWSQEGTLWLWDSAGSFLAALAGHTARVNGALELADGRLLTWSEDHTLRLWELPAQQSVVLFIGDASITRCLVTPQEHIILGDAAGRVMFFQYVSG